MSTQIRMTPDQMVKRAGEVNTQETAFDDVVNKMRSIINELMTEWEGAASISFNDQFEALQPSFRDMKKLLVDIAQQLRNAAEAMEDLDSRMASSFGVK